MALNASSLWATLDAELLLPPLFFSGNTPVHPFSTEVFNARVASTIGILINLFASLLEEVGFNGVFFSFLCWW